jgi:hypothetical protein
LEALAWHWKSPLIQGQLNCSSVSKLWIPRRLPLTAVITETWLKDLLWHQTTLCL